MERSPTPCRTARLPRHRTRRAFTLIELLLVVAIVAVIGTIASPRYAAAVGRYRADVAAKRIASDIRLVQSRARATGTTMNLVFTTANSTYQLPSEKSQRLSTATYFVNLAAAPYYASVVSADFGGDATLQFNGFGLPDSLGSVVIRSGATTRTITIDAGSGIAAIQ